MKKRTPQQMKLHMLQKKYEQTKARIQKIGFICQGSLTKRWLTCGNKNCGCRKDQKKRHGPYYQLSWKEKNKTASRYIAPENIPTYRKWLKKRKELMAIIEEMLAISRKAGECLKGGENTPKKAGRKVKKKPEKKT